MQEAIKDEDIGQASFRRLIPDEFSQPGYRFHREDPLRRLRCLERYSPSARSSVNHYCFVKSDDGGDLAEVPLWKSRESYTSGHLL